MTIDAALDLAEAQTGVKNEKAKLRLSVKKVPLGAKRWTPTEDEFLRANLVHLPEAEIARKLHRTQVAVHLRWNRDLHLQPPSKHIDILTAEHIAWGLGKDSKSIHLLIDRGLLPGRRLNTNRVIRVIDRTVLLRWLLEPLNWCYVDPYRIGTLRPRGKRSILVSYDFAFWEEVRLLVLEARRRWNDEWLTPGQVARRLNLSDEKYINRAIRSGRLPATRWGNWWILRSAIPQGMTLNFRGEWKKLEVQLDNKAESII